MPTEPCDSSERDRRDRGPRVVAPSRLYRPRLLLRHAGPPCAFLSTGAAGPEREVFFAWLIVELARGHGDRPSLVAWTAARDGGSHHGPE